MTRLHQLESGLQVVTEAGDPEEAGDMELAKEIGRVLNRHYEHHPWLIDVQGGALILRHRVITRVADEFLKRSGFGYVMPPHKRITYKQTVASAVQAGGAMLELFGLPRGRNPFPDEQELYLSGLVKIPRDWVKKQQKGFG
jgi:hypothetical protein